MGVGDGAHADGAAGDRGNGQGGRRFTAHEKLRILKEADACIKPGEQGALLRREGLYSSHLVEWRRAQERGELDALSPKKRGRKALPVNPLEKENAERRRALLLVAAQIATAWR